MVKGIQAHKLIVTMYASRTGFKAECSCGKKLSGASGCDRSGFDYAWQALQDNFLEHLRLVERRDNDESVQ